MRGMEPAEVNCATKPMRRTGSLFLRRSLAAGGGRPRCDSIRAVSSLIRHGPPAAPPPAGGEARTGMARDTLGGAWRNKAGVEAVTKAAAEAAHETGVVRSGTRA